MGTTWSYSLSQLRLGEKRRTAEVTICMISERLLDRPRQLPHVQVWECRMFSSSFLSAMGMRYSPKVRGGRPCPSSSEVLADIVRRRACPSSSEVLTGSVRRKGEVPVLPPRRRGRGPPRRCEEEGRRAIPLPPKYPRPSLTKPLDLGVESLSPHPQWECKKQPTLNKLPLQYHGHNRHNCHETKQCSEPSLHITSRTCRNTKPESEASARELQ